MNLEEIIEITMRAGVITLRSGADILRVETTMKKVLEAYSYKGEILVTIFSIFITVFDTNGTSLTRIRRIEHRGTNLTMLEDINQFSRHVFTNPISFIEATKTLDEIEATKLFSPVVQALASAAVSFTFIFFFEGTVPEAIVASIIAIFIFIIFEKILYLFKFTFIEYFFAAFISAVLCSFISHLFPVLGELKLIIGVIMTLLPGGLLASGIKNALNGDIMSGGFMFTEAAFIFSALAGGTGLALSVLWR